MKFFADYRSEKNRSFDHIELSFSCLYWISGNDQWFCRIWKKDWIGEPKYCGWSYGKNKFQAYRLALKNLYD